MGCCQQEHGKPEATKAEGCCGGKSAMKEKCCGGSKIVGFFKKIFGGKCCGSEKCGCKAS